jgi:bacterioferritin
MLHAERVAERILFLGGDVEMVAHAAVQKIHDAAGMLECAKSMEQAAVDLYNASARQCAEFGDRGTMNLFEALIVDEEGHFDAFQTQEEHVKKFGEQYLALQSIEGAKAAGQPGAQA